MGNMDISTDVSNAKNFVFQKQAEIINQIKETLNAVSEAKNNAISASTALDQTNPLKIFTRHKLKKQRDSAERQLLYANSDAIISIFKILAYILELILFCFLIPMGLIQQQYKWVSEGFTQRDENFNHLVGAVGQIAEHVGGNSNRGSSGGSISKGFIRLFIVLIIIRINGNGFCPAESEQKQAYCTERIQMRKRIERKAPRIFRRFGSV